MGHIKQSSCIEDSKLPVKGGTQSAGLSRSSTGLQRQGPGAVETMTPREADISDLVWQVF